MRAEAEERRALSVLLMSLTCCRHCRILSLEVLVVVAPVRMLPVLSVAPLLAEEEALLPFVLLRS